MIRNVCTKAFAMAALVAVFLLLPSAKAEATFAAYICDTQSCSGTSGINFVSATDNGTGDLLSSATGAILLSGVNIGGMAVTVNTSLSQPLLAQPNIDLGFQAVGGLTGGDVWFYATDTDFSVIASLLGAVSATFTGGSGSVEAFVYGGSGNSQFPTSPLLGTSGLLSGTSTAVSTTFAAGSPLANPFAYTLALHITAGSLVGVTGNFGVSGTPIPEPATLSLLGLGLTGIGAAIRRRRKARQSA